MDKITNIEQLEAKMALRWKELLSSDIAKEIYATLGDVDRYALWLMQVAHLTKFTSAHQGLVGTRIREISIPYAKFCFEHALEEVGHEMMAVNDLRKIGAPIEDVDDLPAAFSSTEKLNAYLFYVSERCHPATRLGFSYWAEKCYPYIHEMASTTKETLGLSNSAMTFFVSHSEIDAKHADDVERIIKIVCQSEEDWAAVEEGMITSLDLATDIFKEIHYRIQNEDLSLEYKELLAKMKNA